MKKVEVKMYDQTAGYLVQNEDGYLFEYDSSYLQTSNPTAISLTMPLKATPYFSTTLFPFFDGLIPEGWLLDIAEKNWKLNSRDRMSLLIACCEDCIGAVSIHNPQSED